MRRLDWKFTVLSHNTIRGAAGAALLNAELLKCEGLPGVNISTCPCNRTGAPAREKRPRNHANDRDEIWRHFGGRRQGHRARGRDIVKDGWTAKAGSRGQRHGQGYRHAADDGPRRGKRRSQDRAQSLPVAAGTPLQHCSELLGTALFTEFHWRLGATSKRSTNCLRGIAAVGELTPRTTDHVAAFGEILSSRIVAAAFAAHGLTPRMVDSREVRGHRQQHMRAAPVDRRDEPAAADESEAAAGQRQGAGDGRFHRRHRRRGSRLRSGAADPIIPLPFSARDWAPSALKSGPMWMEF
jgi:hypothetical protein